jgi:hypothetical protein
MSTGAGALASSGQSPLAGLAALLKAPGPEAVDTVLVDCFRFRHEALPASCEARWAATLSSSADECQAVRATHAARPPNRSRAERRRALPQLFRDGVALVQAALYSESGLQTAFPPGFHANLKGLLAKLITPHLPEWRAAAAGSLVSPPKLLDFGLRAAAAAAAVAAARTVR